MTVSLYTSKQLCLIMRIISTGFFSDGSFISDYPANESRVFGIISV
jgi:hypothetical protein